MPRSKIENERIKTEMVNKIMDTAITVFAKKGFTETTISDIAAAAHISIGLMYRYFKSKQDLFDRIIETAVGGIDGLAQLARQTDTPKETVETICQVMIDSWDDEGYMQMSLMVVQGLMSQENPAFEKILAADEKMLDALARLIQAGQAQGVFAQGDCEEKTCLFVSMIQGLTLLKSIFKEKFKPPAAASMMSLLY